MKMKFWLGISLIVFTSSLLGAEDPADQLAERELNETEHQAVRELFLKQQEETHSVQLRLVQTTWLPGKRDPLTADAKVYYKSPATMLIEYLPEGEGSILVLNDIVYAQKKGRKIHKLPLARASKHIGGGLMLFNFLKGDLALVESGYRVKMISTKDLYKVIMESHDTADHSRPIAVEVLINRDALTPRSIRIKHSQEARVEYLFLNYARNQPIDESLFEAPL